MAVLGDWMVIIMINRVFSTHPVLRVESEPVSVLAASVVSYLVMLPMMIMIITIMIFYIMVTMIMIIRVVLKYAIFEFLHI